MTPSDEPSIFTSTKALVSATKSAVRYAPAEARRPGGGMVMPPPRSAAINVDDGTGAAREIADDCRYCGDIITSSKTANGVASRWAAMTFSGIRAA